MPARGEPPDALRCGWCGELLPHDGTCHVKMGLDANHHLLMHAECCFVCHPVLPFGRMPDIVDVETGGHL